MVWITDLIDCEIAVDADKTDDDVVVKMNCDWICAIFPCLTSKINLQIQNWRRKKKPLCVVLMGDGFDGFVATFRANFQSARRRLSARTTKILMSSPYINPTLLERYSSDTGMSSIQQRNNRSSFQLQHPKNQKLHCIVVGSYTSQPKHLLHKHATLEQGKLNALLLERIVDSHLSVHFLNRWYLVDSETNRIININAGTSLQETSHSAHTFTLLVWSNRICLFVDDRILWCNQN